MTMTHHITSHITKLTDRVVLSVTGSDRDNFLQSVISNSIAQASSDQALFTCLLTPQGKVLFDFFIYQIDAFQSNAAYLLDVNSHSAEALEKQLNIYKLRSDVRIARTDIEVSALWGGTSDILVGHGILPDPRSPNMGARLVANPVLELITEPATLKDYTLHRISNGIAEGPIEIDSNRAFPLEYRFDIFNGIDFQKGCFIGQEVTSRAYRKGNLRKQIFTVRIDGQAEIGDEIKSDDKIVGEIRACCDNFGLALVRRDSAAKQLTTSAAKLHIQD